MTPRHERDGPLVSHLKGSQETIGLRRAQPRLAAGAKNRGLQKDHEILLLLGRAGVLKQIAKKGNVPEKRDLFLRLADLIAD